MPLRFSPARGSAALVLNALVRGPTGSAATIAAGTTSTGAAGTSAAVSNSGSTSAAVFDFTIPRGADAGIKWLYESSTSMALPTTGSMRFNNATLASVTAIALSATGSGSDVSAFVATWDDSTNTAKANIVIREEAGAVAAVFSLSAVTNNTTWLQLTVAYVSGSLALTALDPLYIVPLLIGNKGSDGTVAGPGVSVDNEFALWSGTGGATLKRATTTGILKGTSGVISAASAGTDYYNPGGTDVAVADGGTGSSTAAGAATNLGLGTGDSPQFTAINLGHATDTTLARSAAGTMTVEGVQVLLAGQTATITKGFSVTPNNIGTVTTGTTTPDPANGNYQYMTNNGASTIAAPATDCAIDILVTNGASAGSLTFSGFTAPSGGGGDTYATTNTNKYLLLIRRINSIATYSWKALQ